MALNVALHAKQLSTVTEDDLTILKYVLLSKL